MPIDGIEALNPFRLSPYATNQDIRTRCDADPAAGRHHLRFKRFFKRAPFSPKADSRTGCRDARRGRRGGKAYRWCVGAPVYGRSRSSGRRDTQRSFGEGELVWDQPGRLLRIENESVVVLSGGALGNRLAFLGARVETGALWSHVSGRRPFSLVGDRIVSKTTKSTQSMRVEQG